MARAKAKRPYSQDFYAGEGDERTAFYLYPISRRFWLKVRAKAKREKISMRALILGMLEGWLAK